ncbi:MAG TPA: PAS domain S-box protein [Gemmataceae bacterium]|nr:PAS domain S-box protein [Gemmataceae bacterium]
MFRLLVEIVLDHAIFVVDSEGRVRTWNPGAERLLGYRTDEIIGQSANRLFTPEDVEHDVPRQERDRALTLGRSEEDRWHVRKDGSRFWCNGVMTPLCDESGELRGFAKILRDRTGSTRDITDRKRAEEALRESEQRFARFMQHLPGLAWIKDLQGRYIYANDAAVNAFRTTRAKLYGKTDAEVFPPETAAQFKENDRRAVSSEAGVQVIETLQHADGVIHHSLVSKFPIFASEEEAALVGGMAIDITDRLRAEESLKEADRLKDEFLAMLAHELRNPLAPIRNALHILKMPGMSGDMLQHLRDMAERQVQHMARLLDDLLDVSRISRGRIELRKEILDITTVVSRSVEAVRPLFEQQQHELTVSLPPSSLRVEAAPTRLEQVLTNLLNNAAKYTDRGGKIRLTAQHIGGEVVLRVRDTGIGIAAEMLPFIFS